QPGRKGQKAPRPPSRFSNIDELHAAFASTFRATRAIPPGSESHRRPHAAGCFWVWILRSGGLGGAAASCLRSSQKRCRQTTEGSKIRIVKYRKPFGPIR